MLGLTASMKSLVTRYVIATIQSAHLIQLANCSDAHLLNPSEFITFCHPSMLQFAFIFTFTFYSRNDFEN